MYKLCLKFDTLPIAYLILLEHFIRKEECRILIRYRI